MEQATLIDVPPHAGNDDTNFRFTLPRADAWLRRVAQVDAWDMDVAACHESHLAPRYYTLERGEDGLRSPWWGRVFFNPPWDRIMLWVARGWSCWENPVRPLVAVAGLLPLRTHMDWWQEWVEPYRDGRGAEIGPRGRRVRLEVHHPPERFAYGSPGNPRGINAPEPNFQSVGLVWRAAA